MSTAVAVAGDPSSPVELPTGCRFHPRCPIAQAPICHEDDPRLTPGPGAPAHMTACHFAWTTAPPRHVPEVERDAELA